MTTNQRSGGCSSTMSLFCLLSLNRTSPTNVPSDGKRPIVHCHKNKRHVAPKINPDPAVVHVFAAPGTRGSEIMDQRDPKVILL